MDLLRDLESSPVCQSLAMHSFLMLPMQRITRLPLLIDAIYHRLARLNFVAHLFSLSFYICAFYSSRLNVTSDEYESCKEALEILNKLVKDCNESARSMGRMEEMLILSHQLDFKEVRKTQCGRRYSRSRKKYNVLI